VAICEWKKKKPATDVNNNGTACLIFIRPPTPVIPEEKDRKEARGELRHCAAGFVYRRVIPPTT
jgi:hypothetical protein